MAKMDKDYPVRLGLLLGIVILISVVLMLGLFWRGFDFEYRDMAHKKTDSLLVIEPKRGNLYSADGALLATTVTKYMVSMDPVTPKRELFDKNIKSLCDSLSIVFRENPPGYYYTKITGERKKGKRFLTLFKEVTYTQLQGIKGFPIFKEGKYKGGLVYTSFKKRAYPMGDIMKRTIGEYNEDANVKVGLEYALQKFLSGKEGAKLMTKIRRGNWKPVGALNDVDAVEGFDVVSTIDMNMQDIVHHALLNQLNMYKAEHGCAVVMEVATGDVKAIVNLGRTSEGTYYEKLNYAVGEAYEPGSLVKPMTLIAAMEEGKIDTTYVVDTKDGKAYFYKEKVEDSNGKGYGKISIARAMEVSSNTAMALMVNELFKGKPSVFVDKLKAMGMGKELGVEIQGEGQPFIPDPRSKNKREWSAISMEWMAYGYGLKMTPMQVLACYNAIANDGVMVKPKFVKELQQQGKVVEEFPTEIINERMCDYDTSLKLKKIMENVFVRGTARNMYSKNFSMAGKTGTSQTNYKDGKEFVNYVSSFAGFFPAQNPKYSCIVVIHDPDKTIGYYGVNVAGPVFKSIAQKVYTSTLTVDTIEGIEDVTKLAESSYKKYDAVSEKYKTVMPNVVGMPAMDAVALLENMGLKVKLWGNGKVLEQSKSAGEPIGANETVKLTVSN